MGVLDKIKNALFEVEYVEVEEPVKKEKKTRDKDSASKPIAKKIVLPGKKEDKIEELREEEVKDDDFEFRSKEESAKSDHDSFKFMDDNDFKVENEDSYDSIEPEILEVTNVDDGFVNREESRVKKRQDREKYRDEYTKINSRSLNDDDEYLEEHPDNYYKNNQKKSLYSNYESKPYGMDSSYSVPMHEYGTYEKREEKNYFKPSPIISPIYGILDKNYKKEDVVQKKEIRLTTNFSRSSVSVDDIRNKAYGDNEIEEKYEEEPITTFEIDDDEDENLLVDLSDEKGKPEVKELTMGDALEYFQDLGLEYNVDYVDASKDRSTSRRVKDNYDDIEDKLEEQIEETLTTSETKEDSVEEKSIETTNVVKITDESSSDDNLDDDDNLFDLIDSMYQEND